MQGLQNQPVLSVLIRLMVFSSEVTSGCQLSNRSMAQIWISACLLAYSPPSKRAAFVVHRSAKLQNQEVLLSKKQLLCVQWVKEKPLKIWA